MIINHLSGDPSHLLDQAVPCLAGRRFFYESAKSAASLCSRYIQSPISQNMGDDCSSPELSRSVFFNSIAMALSLQDLTVSDVSGMIAAAIAAGTLIAVHQALFGAICMVDKSLKLEI